MSKFDKVYKRLMVLFESVTTKPKITTDQYYDRLDNYLRQYGMTIGENKENPDAGYVYGDQKGIYKGNKQIGKIELRIKGNNLILDNIKSYGKFYNESYGLVKKTYMFHDIMAKRYGLIIRTHAVNKITYDLFFIIFNEFDIRTAGRKLTAIPPDLNEQ